MKKYGKILILGSLFMVILYHNMILKFLNKSIISYMLFLNSFDTVLSKSINICLISFIGLIVCYLIGFLMEIIFKDKYAKKASFAVKHKILNFLLGIFLLILFGGIIGCSAYYLINAIISGLNVLILNIIDTVSKLDAVIIVALITAAVSIISALVSTIGAKILEYRKSRQAYLAKQREIPYGSFVDMFYKLQSLSKKETDYDDKMMLEDISKFSKELTLWGSKKVVKKWVEFRKKSLSAHKAAENLFLLEEIMNEMRKDLGVKKTKKGILLSFFINDIDRFMNKNK